ncbi:MAG: hypothetical protein AAF223_08725 [Bacteroidota bacterium]
MRRKPMWRWLEQQGYLDGDETTLAAGKAAWKKHYHRQYQRQRRQERRFVTLTLEPDEAQVLSQAAGQHRRPLSTFIRESSLAYTQQQFVVPDEASVVAVREELAMVRYSLERLQPLLKQADSEEQKRAAELIPDRLNYLDDFIRQALLHPPLAIK